MMRKGLGKGKGKGYKNMMGKDPKVHSDSAKGRKQPQRLNKAVDFLLKCPKGTVQQKSQFLSSKGYNDNEIVDAIMVANTKDTDKDGVGDILDCDPKDPTKQADSKLFEVKKGVKIVAHYEKTRSGFRHIAVLYVDGQEVDRAKATYLNRTWESYEFESAIQKLLGATTYLSEKEKANFLDRASGKSKEEVESKFKSIGAIAQMGDIFGQTQKEKSDWKKRMLKAGNPNLIFPDDWDTLSEAEKEKRLDNVISFLKKGGKK